MKQTHTLKPDHTLTFNAGQSGKYLILRDTTHSLLLQGDTIRPVEIFGGDTVDVSALDKLELHNHQAVDVTFEYQVSDLLIMTKAQKISVNNALLVSEIEKPINVRKLLDPVKVSDIVTPLKVSEIQTPTTISQIQTPVNVNRVAEPVTVDQITQPLTVERIQQPVNVEIGNASLNVQATITNSELKVTSEPERVTFARIGNGTLLMTGGYQRIQEKSARKALILQALATNEGTVIVQGFLELRPGGHLMLNTNQAVSLKGTASDRLKVGEAL
ncbi:hypothetical protein BCV39_18825 [Vibrio sp. 10N.286.55.E10]|uniref:hypothetical protein n=1 Tax=unclassified Vibrio TaxID=2614977 RepID=UPI000C8173DE|nr:MULTISPECIES: hypothetical protein [unclassified Vibrio]PME33501.1 hypothetical protein BCV40_11920 [Vibrio sp. 10N.286.55.E12]PME35093.1 hypothetical protein BCV39_18825 [Vibrio sp. 10N.286.55.E10]PME67632.1 hypothetical protein BCV32_14590 [Vibrio sp. 10N.286.55.C11]